MLIEEFCSEPDFANIFLEKVGLENSEILEAFHSLSDVSDGESDIIFFIRNCEKTVAIMIEDKIDANAMPFQCERYYLRGKKLVDSGKASSFEVFIAAPEYYLEKNPEAKLYPHSVSYEELLRYFQNLGGIRAEYKSSLLKKALSDCSLGYFPVEDAAVTDFWRKYYAYIKKHFPMLRIKEKEGSRGSTARWAWFSSGDRKMQIIHKANNGFADLTLTGLGENVPEIRAALYNVLEHDMLVMKTEKSAVIRLIVPVLNFRSGFDVQESSVYACLAAVLRLSTLAEKIDYKNLCSNLSGHK